MDDAFGYWLAGFTDGEGAFTICRVTSRNGNPNNRTWPNCRYEITLRADDADALVRIQQTLGFGTIGVHARPRPDHPNERASVRFMVHRIGDCLRVVELFQRYPLRAKKRAQFEVWADAVHEMAKGPDRDDAFIECCRGRLAQLRVYVAPADLADATAGNPPLMRHKREYGEPPACLCGCGGPTRILSHNSSVPHPTNPNYCAFMRGHNRRAGL